ncbi:MAG: amidohydrolase family protein, partial [Bryobacteraceae bacterium]
AIRNARVVPVSGPAIAKGTVVVRNGLIEAVGANVSPPADAWIIEGDGLTVYPGLIDALSTIGIPQPVPTGGGGGRGAAPTTPPPITLATPTVTGDRGGGGGEPVANNQSWVKAADQIQATDRRIATARSAGFTTAVTFPARGIFAGHGAVINLAGDSAGKMIVNSAAGIYLSMGSGGRGGGGGYPGSLMGVIAYIRQTYLDAEHYREAKETYGRNPRGLKRPDYNRELEGVLEGRRVLIPASSAVQIDRMLRFGAEMKLNMILYDAQEGYRLADQIRKANVPVLVSLRWPERMPGADPEISETFRALELRDKAPSTPAALAKAGVRFALYTGGVERGADVMRAVRRAIDSGLPADQAIRALTLGPAELFGVADRLGSIETGKIANLVVTDGDLFQEKTRVRHVLVDGVKYEPAAETPATGERTTDQ